MICTILSAVELGMSAFIRILQHDSVLLSVPCCKEIFEKRSLKTNPVERQIKTSYTYLHV